MFIVYVHIVSGKAGVIYYTCYLSLCSEVIFGYKKLQIKVGLCVSKSNYLTTFQLYYTPGHLNTFIGVNYADKIDPKKHDGLKASDRTTVQCMSSLSLRCTSLLSLPYCCSNCNQ